MKKAKLAFQSGEGIKQLDVDLNVTQSASTDEDELEEMGISQDFVENMDAARELIRDYTEYALTAFRNFRAAEIEELNLKFGIHMGGKAGIPYITEGSAGGNLEITVKCKFHENI